MRPEFREQLGLLIQERKRESFHVPEEVSDSYAFGPIISSYFEHDVNQIVATFAAALEDANAHTFREDVLNLWEQHLTAMENLPAIGTRYSA